jgi:hypothetical protein
MNEKQKAMANVLITRIEESLAFLKQYLEDLQ